MKRRSLLRWLVLGSITASVAGLVLRRPRKLAEGETCTNGGLCRGCSAYAGCGLPTALSMKRETS